GNLTAIPTRRQSANRQGDRERTFFLERAAILPFPRSVARGRTAPPAEAGRRTRLQHAGGAGGNRQGAGAVSARHDALPLVEAAVAVVVDPVAGLGVSRVGAGIGVIAVAVAGRDSVAVRVGTARERCLHEPADGRRLLPVQAVGGAEVDAFSRCGRGE